MKVSISPTKYINSSTVFCARQPVATPSSNYQAVESGQIFSYPKIYFLGNDGDFHCNADSNSSLNPKIRNFNKLGEHSARGETLSSRRNLGRIPLIKKMGIEDVIDLRETHVSEKYPQLCEENGLNYYNIPMDSERVPTDEIIKNLPLLFELINKNRFYIACAQGLHRTDIALALNYIFNPKCTEPPILIGHIREGGIKSADIFRRANSIKSSMTAEDMERLGLDKNFDEIFQARKKELIRYNEENL